MLLEGILEHLVIFNSAVVDDGNVAVLAVMRMGIGIGRFAMGGPAGMGYSRSGVIKFLVGAKRLQIAHLAHGLVNIEFTAIGRQRHTGAVISPVFESMKSFYQDIVDITAADISYYSAHIFYLNLYCISHARDPARSGCRPHAYYISQYSSPTTTSHAKRIFLQRIFCHKITNFFLFGQIW